MKLWKISQSVNNCYDTYDSAVVCADTEEEARYTHPFVSTSTPWYDSWCDAKDVVVEYLGEADETVAKGVVVASFNAG